MTDPPVSRFPFPVCRPQRLLIVRLSSMGDIVHTLPLAENARRAGVEVGWVTERRYADLLEGNPAVSRLFLADTRRWRRSPLSRASRSEIRRLRSELRAFATEAAVDAQGLWKSALVARLAGAPVVSLAARDRREQTSSVLIDRPVALDRRIAHVVDQTLSLLAPLGIPVAAPAPDARYLLRCSRPEADAFADSLPRSFAMLHPGSSRAEKTWGEERFAQLGRRLSASGFAPVVSWGPGDEERADRLATLLPEAARIPRLDFGGLAHLIARAAVFVGGDTGPTHLADALGVRTIGLFAVSARRNIPDRNRPYRGTGLQYDPDTDVEAVVASALESAARGGRGAGERSGETGAVPAASPAE